MTQDFHKNKLFGRTEALLQKIVSGLEGEGRERLISAWESHRNFNMMDFMFTILWNAEDRTRISLPRFILTIQSLYAPTQFLQKK